MPLELDAARREDNDDGDDEGNSDDDVFFPSVDASVGKVEKLTNFSLDGRQRMDSLALCVGGCALHQR